jgi:transposase
VLVSRVVIGLDPHKRSATIEVLDSNEQQLTAGRFGADSESYQRLLAAGRQFPQRIWAVEGCQGVGRHLAQRLVADGETVVDVPAKLSARARVFSTGQGRKTDATDAHSIAVVALRTRSLRQVRADDQTVALRLLADRRDELGAARTLTLNRLHRLLVELVPGGAKKALTARQARALLADVPAGDVVRETCRQLAAELVDELEVIDTRIKTAKKQLAALVTETGSGLMRLNGIGPSGAARLLGDIGDVSRFPTRGHFASWNGTAPLDASSGEQTRHRLSRAGNRRINRALHIMAVVQLRHPGTDGRRYYDRRRAEGKTPMEAMRALKRRLSDVVYRQLVHDQKQEQTSNSDQDAEARRTGPEGHLGATTKSSAAGSNPNADASDKSLSEPATNDATATPDTSPDRTPGRSRSR